MRPNMVMEVNKQSYGACAGLCALEAAVLLSLSGERVCVCVCSSAELPAKVGSN